MRVLAHTTFLPLAPAVICTLLGGGGAAAAVRSHSLSSTTTKLDVTPAAVHSDAVDVLALNDAIVRGGMQVTTCPAGSSTDTICFQRDGVGAVRGLGTVSERFLLVIVNSLSCGSWSFTNAVLTVAGKGTITLSARTQQCIHAGGPTDHAELAYEVTGGTGLYAGASGAGTIDAGGPESQNFLTTDYRGTLVVHGLTFDLTQPRIQVPAKKVVKVTRAKKARVSYTVQAQDDRDGAVTASCKPRSGSRFHVGKTTVKCTATDSSANTAETHFLVVVKRRH